MFKQFKRGLILTFKTSLNLLRVYFGFTLIVLVAVLGGVEAFWLVTTIVIV